jgi:ketosteroid isomerase-like protein
MTRQRILVGLTLAALLGCRPASTQFTAGHRRAIEDSVQTMLTAWRDALSARDFPRAAGFYSTDPAFRWFEDGELKYRSRKEIGDAMIAMAPGFRAFSVTFIEPEITALAPGVAVVTTNFAQKMTDTSGQTAGFAGALSFTVVHADSGWKFLVGHTSAVLLHTDTLAKFKGRKS